MIQRGQVLFSFASLLLSVLFLLPICTSDDCDDAIDRAGGKWLSAVRRSGGNELRRGQAENPSTARGGATRYLAIFFPPPMRTQILLTWGVNALT